MEQFSITDLIALHKYCLSQKDRLLNALKGKFPLEWNELKDIYGGDSESMRFKYPMFVGELSVVTKWEFRYRLFQHEIDSRLNEILK